MIDVSKFVETLEDKPVALFGLGKSGLAAIKALVKAGAKVVAWDDNEKTQAAAEKAGAKLLNLSEEDFSKYACLVLAPGVPLDHAVPAKAKAAGIEILGDIEILHRCGHGRQTIGVTGTNGKSTTVALIDHILRECGKKPVLAGNIGTAVLGTKLPPKKDGVFVLELSSFQIDLCPGFRPDIAALLNVTPDHIDRHGSMEDYAAIKERLFEGEGTAIISEGDEHSKAILRRLRQRAWQSDLQDRPSSTTPTSSTTPLAPISSTTPLAPRAPLVEFYITQDQKEGADMPSGVGVIDGTLYEDGVKIGDLLNIGSLQGPHNHQNAAVAFAACRAAECDAKDIFDAMKTFPGLAHRQFLVRVINGVAYINDSKATNADATAKALACHKNIYWIVGGRAKEGGLNGLESYLDRVRQVFLIGETMEEFAVWFKNRGKTYNKSGTLEVAVQQAHQQVQRHRGVPGGAGTVLLSPACASFDQYKSFEERGDVFVALVNDIEEEAAE